MSQDEILHALGLLVSEMDCKQLRNWVTTTTFNKNPINLPSYKKYKSLFTITTGQWPVMHDMTKITFHSLATIKFDLECQ